MSVPADWTDPTRDPRECFLVPVQNLEIDERVQREVNPERVARIVNEFDWNKFEPLSVIRKADTSSTFTVIEGQHRAFAMMEMNPDCLVWVIVLDAPTTQDQARASRGISKGRRALTAYEAWKLDVQAGEEHEIFASVALEIRGLRLGKSPSSMTIGAVATVRSLVHFHGCPPEAGAELLGLTVDVAMAAYPTHDHESVVARWSQVVLRSLGTLLALNPDADTERLVRALRTRPAGQWVNIGKGDIQRPAHEVMREKLLEEYNRNLRNGRLA